MEDRARDGLGEIWEEVITSIEKLSLSGCYERVNKILSLGLLNRLRKITASQVGGDIILDAGSGPGTSTEILARVHPASQIIMLDPSGPMLAHAQSSLASPRILAVQGRFEAIPLSDESIDGIVAMFSFRDAVSYRGAVKEFYRVLKPGGALAILDFYRPVQPWKAVIKTYIALMVPIALLISGCAPKLSLYRGFLSTIDRMLSWGELREVLSNFFSSVEIRRIVPGLAIIWAIKKT